MPGPRSRAGFSSVNRNFLFRQCEYAESLDLTKSEILRSFDSPGEKREIRKFTQIVVTVFFRSFRNKNVQVSNFIFFHSANFYWKSCLFGTFKDKTAS